MYARIDEDLAALYAELPAADLRDVDALRAGDRDAAQAIGEHATPFAVHRIEDAGDPVAIAEYHPAGTPRAVVVHVHGGGFVTGSATNPYTARWCARLARATDSVVLAVEYRLAPEHPFPAGHDDCYRAVEWAAAHRQGLGADPEAPIILHGQSAGGALAAGVALRLRDEARPILDGLVLDAPVADDRLQTPSMRGSRGGPVWTIDAAVPSWRMYLADGAGASSYAAPARAADFRGLPPVFIAVNALDALRDEAVEIGMRMAADGVDTDIRVYARTVHGTALVGIDLDVGRAINRDQYEAIGRLIARRSTPESAAR